jgi:hypothetical protein
MFPSAEEATDLQVIMALTGRLFEVQVLPEFVEVYIESFWAAATSLVPSAEEATDDQYFAGVPDAADQVPPEFVEV